MDRLYEYLIALLCVFFGGLSTLTGLGMTLGMLLSPNTRAENLFWVGLAALALAPPIFVAGIRLLLNKPNKHGGLFAPYTLRGLAVVNGILGGAIIIFAINEGSINGFFGGISFLVTTQGAFVLANKRDATEPGLTLEKNSCAASL